MLKEYKKKLDKKIHSKESLAKFINIVEENDLTSFRRFSILFDDLEFIYLDYEEFENTKLDFYSDISSISNSVLYEAIYTLIFEIRLLEDNGIYLSDFLGNFVFLEEKFYFFDPYILINNEEQIGSKLLKIVCDSKVEQLSEETLISIQKSIMNEEEVNIKDFSSQISLSFFDSIKNLNGKNKLSKLTKFELGFFLLSVFKSRKLDFISYENLILSINEQLINKTFKDPINDTSSFHQFLSEPFFEILSGRNTNIEEILLNELENDSIQAFLCYNLIVGNELSYDVILEKMKMEKEKKVIIFNNFQKAQVFLLASILLIMGFIAVVVFNFSNGFMSKLDQIGENGKKEIGLINKSVSELKQDQKNTNNEIRTIKMTLDKKDNEIKNLKTTLKTTLNKNDVLSNELGKKPKEVVKYVNKYKTKEVIRYVYVSSKTKQKPQKADNIILSLSESQKKFKKYDVTIADDAPNKNINHDVIYEKIFKRH